MDTHHLNNVCIFWEKTYREGGRKRRRTSPIFILWHYIYLLYFFIVGAFISYSQEDTLWNEFLSIMFLFINQFSFLVLSKWSNFWFTTKTLQNLRRWTGWINMEVLIMIFNNLIRQLNLISALIASISLKWYSLHNHRVISVGAIWTRKKRNLHGVTFATVLPNKHVNCNLSAYECLKVIL